MIFQLIHTFMLSGSSTSCITFNKASSLCLNILLSAICSGFVSHLQAQYTIVVGTICYNAVSGLDGISSDVMMECYKK